MNPTALKQEWFAFQITEKNKDELAAEFNNLDVMPAIHSESPTTFVPGHVAIVRLVSADDPFVASLGTRQYSVWIATQQQFESKFEVTGVDRLYTQRLSIRYKL